jgi:hypothetical protein
MREELKYIPCVKLAIVTIGKTATGRTSQTRLWMEFTVRQLTPDRHFYYGRDTIGQNAFIHYKEHWLEHAEFYKDAIRPILRHFKQLQPQPSGHMTYGGRTYRVFGPYTTVVQQYDASNGRKVYHTFADPLNGGEADVNAIFDAIVASLQDTDQGIISDTCLVALNELRRRHTEAHPDCTEGCPAHEAMDQLTKAIETWPLADIHWQALVSAQQELTQWHRNVAGPSQPQTVAALEKIAAAIRKFKPSIIPSP